MVAAEDLLADSLSTVIDGWFNSEFSHPFLGLHTVSVSEAIKPIPKRWVEDVEVNLADEAECFDVLGEGMVTSWSAEEGRGRLREALRRLDLREDSVAHPDLNKMGKNELAGEKRRVKQELKRYDSEFRKQFMRLPTHTEKEPMRPLYVYYRRLKNMLTQAEAGGKQGRPRPNAQLRGTANAGSDDEASTGAPGARFGLEPDDMGQRPSTGGPHGNRDARGGSLPERRKDQIQALEARIDSLQGEKGNVRAKLQAFQEKFVTENNRKIRFHKDILPIEREYRMYKNLKEEIMRAEATLRDLRTES